MEDESSRLDNVELLLVGVHLTNNLADKTIDLAFVSSPCLAVLFGYNIQPSFKQKTVSFSLGAVVIIFSECIVVI